MLKLINQNNKIIYIFILYLLSGCGLMLKELKSTSLNEEWNVKKVDNYGYFTTKTKSFINIENIDYPVDVSLYEICYPTTALTSMFILPIPMIYKDDYESNCKFSFYLKVYNKDKEKFSVDYSQISIFFRKNAKYIKMDFFNGQATSDLLECKDIAKGIIEIDNIFINGIKIEPIRLLLETSKRWRLKLI